MVLQVHFYSSTGALTFVLRYSLPHAAGGYSDAKSTAPSHICSLVPCCPLIRRYSVAEDLVVAYHMVVSTTTIARVSLFALVAKFLNVFEISLQPTHNGPIQRPLATILSLVSPEQSESLLLQKHWTLPCLNLPALRSPPYRFQNQTAACPTRRRCPPDIRRQQR